jgi:glycyl-tRNA synthetase (class II)
VKAADDMINVTRHFPAPSLLIFHRDSQTLLGSMAEPKENPLMEKIVSLCKRRGFIFQSSEIYGGINGFWDYGPLGVELRKNIRDCWWNDMVRSRDDVVGLESSIIMHPKVWEASGHIGGFNDPMVDCKVSKQRFRADQLFFAPVVVDGKIAGYVSALESETTAAELQEQAEKFKRKKAIQGKLEPVQPKDFTEAKPEEIPLIPSPATGEPGSLTPPRAFNMMLSTYVGALRDESAVAYLRPETAQGMFVDFKAVLDTGRVKIPFGIAQVGKSFRNEITPRNFIFRSREFEQMEMEFFISDEDDWQKWHRYWIDWCRDWLVAAGIPVSQLSEYNHPKEKLSHYRGARRTSCSASRSACRNCGASPRVAILTCRSTRNSAGSRWSISTTSPSANMFRTSSNLRWAWTESCWQSCAAHIARTRHRTKREKWNRASCCVSRHASRRSRSPYFRC